MKFTSALTASLALLAPSALAAPKNNANSSCCRKDLNSNEYHKELSTNYLNMWSGNLTIAETILHPDLTMYADRLPSANGSDLIRVTTRDEFVAFIGKSRTGWQKYWFDMIHWVGTGDKLAMRWKMNGLVGENMAIPTTLDPGAYVTYNGTDFVVLDDCTGQIKEINMAQDFIAFFHELGIKGVMV
ncbi:unnamed protein product [Clonostachys rosea]|uniref:SnoaL-like domain-containing protein n=1 Tax=Bionectria ochroleuca TaxID=29856 RepID=A0ABY6UJA7_BIOOC|nr:unnamed protein product [Clonostachys rosea]